MVYSFQFSGVNSRIYSSPRSVNNRRKVSKISTIRNLGYELSKTRFLRLELKKHYSMLKRYFTYNHKHIKYTKDEQNELVQKAKNGDLVARDKLWESCYGLVYWFISRVYVPTELIEDCIQEGLSSVPDAINSYDPSKNCLFTSYFIYHIFKNVQKLLWSQRFFLKYPAYFYTFLIKYSHLQGFSDDDKRKELFIKNYKIENFDDISSFRPSLLKALVLSSSFQENNFEFVPFEDDSHKNRDKNDVLEYIEYAINHVLKEKEREMIKIYFGFYGKRKTYRQIAKFYYISHERVRQIVLGACQKLKRHFERKKLLEDK